MATWRNISRISSRVTPLVSAALMCVRNSLGRLRTEIMARLSMLRVLRASPSRPHTAPQQYSVMRSCNGLVKSFVLDSAWLTYSSPSTADRISSPRWYVSRSNGFSFAAGRCRVLARTNRTGAPAASQAHNHRFGGRKSIERLVALLSAIPRLLKAAEWQFHAAARAVELPFGGFKKSGYGREKGYEA